MSSILQEEKYEFIISPDPQPLDPGGIKVRNPPPYLSQLLSMENYYTIVSYTKKHLLTALSEADRQYFHHSIRYDKASKKIFVIFYALHEKHSHSHVRRSETRLHSRADFATFVCNIMENVRTWADENLNRAYRCPRRAGQISPQFPYGCQSQLAYQNQCTEFLDSPENDHFQMFLRKSSLKNLVRNNKNLFAQRCNWRFKLKEQNSANLQSVNQPNATPAEQVSRLYVNQSNASLTASSANSNTSVISTADQAKNSKKEKSIPPFIWNRANEPLPPDCTAASAHRLTSAYSLTNVLTKMVRHEEKIYCPDAMILIDSSESFNEKIFVHITALMNEDLEVYVNDSEQGRRISIEFDTSTFLSFEKDETGQVAIGIFDINGIVTRIGNDEEVFCEMEVVTEKNNHGKTFATAVRRNGIVHRVLTNGTLDFHQPDGRRAKLEDEEPPLVFQESVEDFQRPLTPTRKSMYHFEPPHTIVYISSSGLQRSYEKHRSGFLRKVQVDPELRITTHRVYPEEEWNPVEEIESDESVGKPKPVFIHYSPRNKIVVEQPGFPRVVVDRISELNYVSLQNGVLLVKKHNSLQALIAGVNVVLITADGLFFAGKLLQYCEIFELTPIQIGIFSYASPEFVEFADMLVTKATEDSGWQRNEALLKFALSGEILATCQDLSGIKHDILQNGEAVHQVWEDKVDRCVMPSPRVFVIDPEDKTGNEYLFGEQAVALKYKIVSHHIPNKRCRYPDSTLPIVIQKECFGCSISDEPLGEWCYTDRDVLPAALLSDLKGTTDYRAADGSAPRDRAFRYRNESSETVVERWKKVLFVPERLKKN
ncbi:hypothetical protein RvY_16561-2 [Ramazzottius varieornatus]|uniref:Uncharacterized protein n=1 Tax=Ramazzottius varieornatus TaxID=947166 RepID=A0A1D1W383_RAMVA|nr:hypothetical protein RvY_16561-2 [Ramazzottius varieornatus]